jgi:MFS family permease
MADWSSLYYRDAIGERGGISTTGYTAFTLSMTLGRLVGDRLIQWMGYRRMLMINGLLIAAGMTVAVAWPKPGAVIAGFALVGLGVSSVIPIAYMIAGRSRSMAPAAALAAVSAIGFTGFLLGPPLIGFIANEVTLRYALLLVAAMGAVIFLVSSRSIGTSDAG